MQSVVDAESARSDAVAIQELDFHVHIAKVLATITVSF